MAASTAGSVGAPAEATAGGLERQIELRSTLSWPARTDLCGRLTENDVGKRATLCGWVHRHRNMGGLVFSDVRDHTGILQVSLFPKAIIALQ